MKISNTVYTRKYKDYTAIYITDFSDETLDLATKANEEIEISVIRPKRSAIEDYIKRYDVKNKIEKAKQEDVGYRFEIAGFYFTKLEDMQGCHLSLRDEKAYEENRISDFGIINLNDVLIENIFQKITGTRLFF